MKRLTSVLLAAAMTLGALATTGCNKPAAQSEEPETAPTAAAAADDGATTAAADTAPAATEEDVKVTASVQVPAPPALRTENPGKAPSSRHVFQRGFWRYDGARTGYVWVPGHWEERGVFAPTAPPPPRFENRGRAPGALYVYVPGYWRYDGRAYVWVGGHWSLRSDVGHYYRTEYTFVNGRWVRSVDRWDAARMAAHERAEREARARAARERAERSAHERAEREARERHERAEREAREQAAKHAEHDKHPKGSYDKPAGNAYGHDKPAGNAYGHDKAEEKGGHDKPGKVATTAAKPAAPRAPIGLTKKPAARGRG